VPATRVSYKSAPDQMLTVRLIHAWHRGDITEPIMSASSGPKAYTANDVFYLFDTNPLVEAVLMVRANGRPFFLMRVGRQYFDVGHREVEVECAEVLCSSSS
jgi:hypothetical protein